MGTKISEGDEVRVDGNLISNRKEELMSIAVNQAVGIVCTTNTKVEKDNIIDFINYPKRIFPIGRIDKQSEGLIFLTNAGDIVNKIGNVVSISMCCALNSFNQPECRIVRITLRSDCEFIDNHTVTTFVPRFIRNRKYFSI